MAQDGHFLCTGHGDRGLKQMLLESSPACRPAWLSENTVKPLLSLLPRMGMTGCHEQSRNRLED